MLKLEKITKIYDTAGFKQKALDEVSMNFRQCEFVSILGPSGSGKTTLLNIIGGLDNYTSGDLVINNISTKKYKDRDWDTYRNHSVGFVFQSYNLIPHQSILSNVELALTLCGVSKSERRKRAKEALKEVGLGNHLGKKPNQLSGGQMQRVAIARALVNNPDILLADEPTGALDSETSTQIMELLKKVANDRLVIMVTHNSELAEEYSTRIIKVKDGVILNDTNPYDEEITTENNITEDNKKKKKTSMSFRTALSLSLNNLMTKKGRTLLTAFAGSIGIIGIALILSLSNGVQNYINKVQEDTLSNYPLTIQEESVDASSMIEIFMNNDGKKYDDNKIHSRQVIGKIFETISEEAKRNNLKAFKEYIEKGDNDIKKYSNVVQYGYNMTPNIYKSDTKDGVVQVNPATTFEELGMTSSSDESSYMMGQSTDVWTEMIDNDELLKSQYDVLSGVWPEKYNEAMLIVNENNEISDYSLYSLGIKDQNDITEKMHKIMSGEKLEKIQDETYSYEDFLGLKYKVLLNTDYYEKQGNSWISKRNDEKYMKSKLKNALEVKIVGIVRPKKEVAATSMGDTGMVGYRKELTEYIINGINDSKIAKEQLDKPEINVFTGRKFELKKKTDSKFDFSSLSKEEQKYLSSLSEEEMAAVISSYTEMSTSTYEENISKLGICNLDEPSSINIYPVDFESKDKITVAIKI